MFQDPNDYFRVQKSPFLILSKTNTALILSSHQALGIPSYLLYSQFFTKTHYGLLFFTHVTHIPPISLSLTR